MTLIDKVAFLLMGCGCMGLGLWIVLVTFLMPTVTGVDR